MCLHSVRHLCYIGCSPIRWANKYVIRWKYLNETNIFVYIYFRWTNIYLGERQICTYDTHKCMKCPIKEQGTLVCEY